VEGRRWLHLHEYIKAYKGTVSIAVPVDAVMQFGVNEDGTTWLVAGNENHVVTESFEEIFAAVTAQEWDHVPLTEPPSKDGGQ